MLKLQYFGHRMRRADSLEKILMLGKIEGRRRRGRQRVSWSDGIIDSMDMSLSKFWEIAKDREACRAVVHGVAKTEQEQRSRGWARLRGRDLCSVPPTLPSSADNQGSLGESHQPTGDPHRAHRKFPQESDFLQCLVLCSVIFIALVRKGNS